MPITHGSLPGSPRATIIQPRVKHVTILALCLLTHGALAQQQSDSKPESRQRQDDLDVTMQIIVDPDAKLPDEVVRRIPLPERKSADSSAAAADEKAAKAAAAESKQAAREAKELAKEASQAAKEEAAEQREAARRARAEERERENHPPGNPNPPGRPPR